jgi:NhaP-type Na+/H+ or K+/H+ antiporter
MQGIPADQIYLEEEVDPSLQMGRKGGEVSRAESERRYAGLESGLIIGLTVGVLAGLGVGMLGGAILEWMRSVQPTTPELSPILASPWLSAMMGGIIGLIAGGLIGWVVDYTLTQMGAGPPLPKQETLVTVRTTDEELDRVYAALFRARARHLHVATSASV